MVTEIFINNTEVDLSEDISIPLNYAIADIREPQKRNTNFSKTVVLPGTANNNVLFSHIWDIGVNLTSSGGTNFTPNFNPNLKADVLVLQDGNEVFKGFAKLDNIVNTDGKVEYEMSFYGNLANIFTTIGDKKLSEIDLSEYDHTYNKTNQVNSWNTSIIKNGSTYVNFASGNPTGEGYVYPLIDYGFTNGTTFKVEHWFPAIYVKTIIDKIFAEAGFQYSSNFFNSTFFKRLIVPFSKSVINLNTTQILNRQFRSSNNNIQAIFLPDPNVSQATITEDIEFDNDTTGLNNDAGNNYNTATYKFTVPYTATYKLTFYMSINVKHNNTVNNDNVSVFSDLGFLSIRTQNQVLSQYTVTMFSGPSIQAGNIHIETPVAIPTGSTSSTTTGIQQVTVYLTAGTQVWCDFHKPNGYTAFMYDNGGNCNLNITTDSYFEGVLASVPIIEGDPLSLNDTLPENIKQADFISSIFKMFNLYIDQDKTITNKLVIEPRDEYYSSSGNTTLDWSYKLDYSKAYETKPMGDLESKRYIFTYKDDGDYYNEFYKKKYSETYGYKDYEIENDFLKSDIKNEVIFSPTPLADYLGIDRVIPKIFVIDNNGQPKPKATNIRILYYGGVKNTSNPYSYVDNSGTTIYTTYPYAGHLDDPLNPTLDLNFGSPIEVFYTTLNYTNNNLFNKYWKKFVQEISDINSKIFTGYFYLTPLDIAKLDFKNFYYFEGEYWRLNRIFDYNPNQMSVTKCEFIKLIEYPTFEPTNTTNVGSGVLEDGVTGWFNTQRTGTVFGGDSLGENVFIDDTVIGAKVSGSDIYISAGAKGISVLGSSGVTVTGGIEYATVLNSNGVEITKDKSLYINSLAIKDTASGVRVKSITGNYTALWSDTVLLVNATGGNITITLPDSALVASTKDEMGKLFYIKKVDASANTVTIDGYSAQTIDGAATYVINTQYDSVTIVSDGSNYHIV
jgi:hypothetical protein